MEGFIEVHIGEESKPRLINLSYIKYISGSSIIRTEGSPIICNETYEELYQKLKDTGALHGHDKSQ